MTVQAPIPDYAAARRAMVENQLRPQGVVDHALVEAMRSVPREQFVPESVRPLAYTDRSIALGQGRYLSAPHVLGQLLTQMMPEPGQRALVVGAATGYAVAVLAHMGLDVVGLESAPELAGRGRELGLAIAEGPLEAGYKKKAPYDQILVDGAIEFVPDALVKQLADGGRLGAALVERGITRLIVGRKAGGGFGHLSVADAAVAALPGFTRPRAFTF